VAANDERLEAIASDILDGTAIDWNSAGSSVDSADLPIVEQLQVVAAVAELHRVPAEWGSLRILERIGRGTFGDVYRAWDARLDREVALKLIPAEAARSGTCVIHEGRLLARVRHNNVVTIHGAEQVGDAIGIWMELVRGQTLAQRLQAGGPLSPDEATRIVIDLCHAVSAVHDAGLLHRDIKAHNVMLGHDGRVVLMDFGTGRELTDAKASDLAGTPLYVAPEVLDGNAATAQSDVYSLGVLLFHLLTGAYPVHGQTLVEIRAAHANRSTSRMRALRPDVPADLAKAIERALEYDPARRYASAAALADALVAAGGGRRRGRLVYSGIAAAAVVLVGAALWERQSNAPPRTPPTIAVLPFKSTSATPDGEELADGLTHQIQRNLASIDGLSVRSLSSSLAFKNRARNLAEVGSQLGVEFVLEGSAVRSGSRVQVDARFARVSGDVTIWSERFDRDVRDLAAVLDDISMAIVNEMRVALGRGQRRYDLDPDAYFQFLRASSFQARRNPENSAKAAALFEQLANEHPTYAPAWAGLANSLAELSRPSTGEEIIPLDPRMAAAALRAIQLDPLLAEAHAAIANRYAHERDWVNGRMSFLKAIELNPSLTTTYTDFVLGVLMPLGDSKEGLKQLEAARVADPLSLDVRRIEAHVLIQAGRYNDAIETCRWIMQHDPAFPYVDVWLGRALYFSGRFDEAEVTLTRAGPQFFGYLGYMLAVSGRRDEALALASKHPDSPSRTMLIHAGLGDSDRAFEGLAQTAEINWWRAATWMHRPEMALLRDDPRMPALRKKLGLPSGSP
jgi:eukaryotic-like serine/threonine-protein kinase